MFGGEPVGGTETVGDLGARDIAPWRQELCAESDPCWPGRGEAVWLPETAAPRSRKPMAAALPQTL